MTNRAKPLDPSLPVTSLHFDPADFKQEVKEIFSASRLREEQDAFCSVENLF